VIDLKIDLEIDLKIDLVIRTGENTMETPVLIIMCAFFVIGGFDYIFGSPLRLGNKFEEGIRTMGPLALGIIGIYSLAPFLLTYLTPATGMISLFLHIDPSILPACIFPVDMGGYQIAQSLASSPDFGRFSGIIIASTIGATISFSIPVACKFIKKEDNRLFAEGLVIGIISIVPGCFLAGLLSGIDVLALIKNMLPLFVIIALLSVSLIKAPAGTLNGFIIFGKVISAIGIIGLLFQGLDVILGVKIIPNLIPFSDTAVLVGKIALILGGAYPMMEVLNRVLKRSFVKIGSALRVNSNSIAAIIGNLASNILVWGTMKDLDERGKVLCTALAVSAAFVLGGQFAYVVSVEPSMAGPFFAAKLASGAISIILTMYLLGRKNYQVKVPGAADKHTESV